MSLPLLLPPLFFFTLTLCPSPIKGEGYKEGRYHGIRYSFFFFFWFFQIQGEASIRFTIYVKPASFSWDSFFYAPPMAYCIFSRAESPERSSGARGGGPAGPRVLAAPAPISRRTPSTTARACLRAAPT